MKGYSYFVNKLTRQISSNINLQDHTGNTSLMLAVSADNIKIVKILLKRKDININIQNGYGETALIIASKLNGKHSLHIAQLLIDNGDLKNISESLDIKDEVGLTALMYAAHYNNKKLVKLLLGSGANPFILDNEGKTAMDSTTDR